jgi:hypothetical protein
MLSFDFVVVIWCLVMSFIIRLAIFLFLSGVVNFDKHIKMDKKLVDPDRKMHQKVRSPVKRICNYITTGGLNEPF